MILLDKDLLFDTKVEELAKLQIGIKKLKDQIKTEN